MGFGNLFESKIAGGDPGTADRYQVTVHVSAETLGGREAVRGPQGELPDELPRINHALVHEGGYGIRTLKTRRRLDFEFIDPDGRVVPKTEDLRGGDWETLVADVSAETSGLHGSQVARTRACRSMPSNGLQGRSPTDLMACSRQEAGNTS